MSEIPKPPEEQREKPESDVHAYEEIEYFAQAVYPELVKLADEITKVPSAKAIESAQSFIGRLKKDKIFSHGFYNTLLDDAELGKTLKHDIGTPATTFFLHVGILSEFTPSKPDAWERFGRSLHGFLKVAPRYFIGLEDILLRKIEKSGQAIPDLPLNAAFADKALTELRSSSELQGRVRELFGVIPSEADNEPKPLQHFPALAEEEHIMAPTGEVMNALFNIIRNASKTEVGAEHGACEISRVGDEVIIRVIDDGHGIPGDKLESIFEKGVSFTGSSGLGLAGLDERFAKKQVGFLVASRSKLSQPADPAVFGETHIYPEAPTDTERLQSLLNDRNAATVFEIRLPISRP